MDHETSGAPAPEAVPVVPAAPSVAPARRGADVARGEVSDFAHEFRHALAARRSSLRGLSLSLQHRDLHVSTPRLAAWRSGTIVPAGPEDLRAARALEDVLELPAGHLTRWIDPTGTPQRSARHTGALAAAPATPLAGELAMLSSSEQRARTALGFERSGLLTERAVEVELVIDEHGTERHITQCTEWVAQEDGVDTFPSVLAVPTPVRGRSRIEPLGGCRLGPSYVDLAEGVFATALVLPAPLMAGETATTVHRTHLPEDITPDVVYEHRVLHRVERVEVRVRFEPTCAPTSWRGHSRTEEQERGSDVVPVDGVARVARDDFGPGTVGLRWSW
ncbi:hypothetical protein ACFP83_06220 [Nocardioides daphniae]